MGKNKKNKKLGLRKETIRKLDAGDLGKVNGGALLAIKTGMCIALTGACLGDDTLACIRVPTYTCGCDPDGFGGYR